MLVQFEDDLHFLLMLAFLHIKQVLQLRDLVYFRFESALELESLLEFRLKGTCTFIMKPSFGLVELVIVGTDTLDLTC
jgi:hypothetical protein